MNRQEEVLFSIMRGFFENPNFENLFRLFQGEDRILYYLSTQNRADITPSELSERLHITRARATAAVQELERKQYVARIRSQKDKRRIYLSITEDGTSYIRHRVESAQNQSRELLAALGESDAAEMIRLLLRLFELFNKKTASAV